ncbi:S28 family serine protease [Aestuariivivens sediminis]|uniref:S28 family serine protease n=1 Tax=Aestuariivivens sediminis TaxID=2913557 RepID=UPI001F5983DA|nr:S28 family serine protease [Aestuariivivens sediminis]
MNAKHILYLFLLVSILTHCKIASPTSTQADKSTFEKLASIPIVVKIEKRDPISHFDENYEIWFEQPIDYNDLSKGTFKQRVYLGFENTNKPVIVNLRGYGIGNDKANELADHYKTNQLTIEHRYFNTSRPENIDWNTLTIANAARDQARIIDAIRQAVYPHSKFISTGISKGCQTAMAHRRFFPKNVDACVCYVGPLNFQREDPRIYEFLKTVGTNQDRAKIKAFQDLCFENRAALLEQMKAVAKKKNLSWEFGVEKALDYTILEYAFAFWQWGKDLDNIPLKTASIQTIYDHLIDVVGYGFFEASAVEYLQPYFWAALTEQGIYGYETGPFKDYLNTDAIYKFDWAFPDSISKPFNPIPMKEIKSFLDTSAEKMLFIYGEYDAWSATAVNLNGTAKRRELYKFTLPKGDHKTRIKNFDKESQEKIFDIIDHWLK